jgi:NADPH:quinone reductase-like Zn-dependent oxidoreductase
VTDKPGDYDFMRLRDVPLPALGPREVLVRNFASGVCYHDHLIRVGVMKRGITFPLILGHEGAGIVETVGDGVRAHQPGDHVACTQWTEACGMCRFCRTNREPLCAQRKLYGHDRDGTYAEFFKIQEDSLLPLPAEIPFEQGAILSCAIGTVLAAIRDVGQTRAGERLLVTGAGGGLGAHAIQVGKLCGAVVVAQTSSPGKVPLLQELGADHVVISRDGRFADEVKRVTDGEGVDVVFDAQGPRSFRKSYRVLRPGGRLIMYGLAEASEGESRSLPKLIGSLARMPLATMPWWKSLQVMNENKGVFGLNMLSWWDTEGDIDRITGPLVEEIEQGDLQPIVAEAFPFDRAGDAHRFIAERKNIGKVVLVP